MFQFVGSMLFGQVRWTMFFSGAGEIFFRVKMSPSPREIFPWSPHAYTPCFDSTCRCVTRQGTWLLYRVCGRVGVIMVLVRRSTVGQSVGGRVDDTALHSLQANHDNNNNYYYYYYCGDDDGDDIVQSPGKYYTVPCRGVDLQQISCIKPGCTGTRLFSLIPHSNAHASSWTIIVHS